MPDEPEQDEGKLLLAALGILMREMGKQTRLPTRFLESLIDSDDWSLIIKLHALIELAMNTLVTHGIGDGRVLSIVMRLDASDKYRGKMAFIKALDLLPPEARAFISQLSELRNDLVHNLFNFDFSLGKWIREMQPQDLANFTKSLNFGCEGSSESWYSKEKDKFRNLSDSTLKALVILHCFFIVDMAIDKEFEKLRAPLESELKRLTSLIDTYEAGKREGGSESNPKES